MKLYSAKKTFGPACLCVHLGMSAAAASETTLSFNQPSSHKEQLADLDHEGDSVFALDRVESNLRAALDFSSRVSLSSRSGKVSAIHAFGLDLHKVFSDEEGDWGTLRMQTYLTRLDNVGMRPPFFEDEDDWEMVFRIFDFNFRRWGRGKFNVRIGHFEIPYGLEHLIPTNGTLRQFMPGRNLGLKADWGVSVNGDCPEFHYEVSLTRGTGNEYFDRGNPYAVAGRISTPIDRAVIVGASAFHGRIWSPPAVGLWKSGLRPPSDLEAGQGLTDTSGGRGRDNIIRRSRFGLDLQVYTGPIGVLAEASYGRDYNQDVVNGLLELNWESPADRWFLYGQATLNSQRFDSGWDCIVQGKAGVLFRPNNRWSLSAQFVQDIDRLPGQMLDSIITVQTRFRF